MRKELYFKLLNYLWDLKEHNNSMTIDLRMLQYGTREPIVVNIPESNSTFYIDVMDENYDVEIDGVSHLGVTYEELVQAIILAM